MIVTAQTYHIILIAIVILVAIRPLYTRYIKKQGHKHDWMFALLLLLLPVNWYTPTIITVNACGKFSKEVVLFPGEKDGVQYHYGWNNFIVNKSLNTLAFEYLFYGDNARKEDQVDKIIQPGQIEQVNVVTIDYLFEQAAKTVSTKSSGATKTTLYCL